MTRAPHAPYRSLPADWPALDPARFLDTLATLHMWTQIVGKVRMELMPWINHSWSVPLYLSPRGLRTSPIPAGAESFEVEFDFLEHRLPIVRSDGERRSLELRPRSVADFHRELLSILHEMGIDASIHPLPNEVADPIPFPEDEAHASYEPGQAHALWRALLQAHRVLTEFRARFIGKVSPVHFFWGGFDLAVTRFSGEGAPPHPGGIPHLPDEVTREAYSHEVSSAGFWPGSADAPGAVFYSYAYPTPDGFASSEVEPEAARWLADLGEFVLPYEAVRESASPDETLLAFLESTYAAAADLQGWDREALERPAGYRPL